VSDLSREERYEIQRRGGEAHRLLQDAELMSILTFIREGAVQTAVHGTDVREREDARNRARAIDHLATEMRTRLDTALLQGQREADGRRFE
jgi:hypothetical protein